MGAVVGDRKKRPGNIPSAEASPSRVAKNKLKRELHGRGPSMLWLLRLPRAMCANYQNVKVFLPNLVTPG